MQDEGILKAGSGLHGGIGVMRDTCGSLLGACMMLSYAFGSGRDDVKDSEQKEKPSIPVGKIYKWFEKEFSTNKCREIVTRHAGGVFYDTSVPWQQELAIEAGVYEKCDILIKKTSAKAAELIWEAYQKKRA